MNPSIEAVTFDAGGTLIDPWPSVGAVYASVARDFGLDCCPDTITAQFASAWKRRTPFRYTREEWAEVVRHSFHGQGHVSPALFNAIYDRFAEPDTWLIYSDVIPTLQALEKLGVKLAVISNWDNRLRFLLNKLGLATYFQHIVVSSEIDAHKPDPRIFLHTAELLNVPAEKILHVGDTPGEDIAGAHAVNAFACRIRRSGVEQAGDIPRLTEILNVLENPIKLCRRK